MWITARVFITKVGLCPAKFALVRPSSPFVGYAKCQRDLRLVGDDCAPTDELNEPTRSAPRSTQNGSRQSGSELTRLGSGRASSGVDKPAGYWRVTERDAASGDWTASDEDPQLRALHGRTPAGRQRRAIAATTQRRWCGLPGPNCQHAPGRCTFAVRRGQRRAGRDPIRGPCRTGRRAWR